MSKSNPSDIKVAVPTPGAFAGLKALNLQVFVMIAAIIVIMLFFTWMTDGSYLSARNVSNLLRQTAITGILAVGMVFVIISAEIDLSVGSMMGLLGGVAAIFDVWLGWPLPLTVAVTLVLGAGDFALTRGGFTIGGIGTATFGAILLNALLSRRMAAAPQGAVVHQDS